MSTGLAIAAVTGVLRNLLMNNMTALNVGSIVGEVVVTAESPNRIATNETDERNQINLFLYQVIPNQGWRNVGLPWRDDQGTRLSNPPLALDLHYLLTAYGTHEIYPDILLGYAMQFLHETPVLTRDAIRATLNPAPGNTLPAALATAELADQIEQIKICPLTFSLEEISKLWAALQTPYRTTAAYQVSAVLIESRRSFKPALPVRKPKLHVVPLNLPVIESIEPQVAHMGETLTIKGFNFQHNVVSLNFGAIASVQPDTITDTQITVKPPTGLLAGINTIQVVQSLDFGTSVEPHPGFESNAAAFMLAPTITTAAPFAVTRGSTLTLTVAPPIGRDQTVQALVGDQTVMVPPRPSSDPPTSSTIDIPFPAAPGFPAGTFLLRLQVQGAQSALTVDANQRYNGPMVVVS